MFTYRRARFDPFPRRRAVTHQGFPPPRSAPTHGRDQPRSGLADPPEPGYGDRLDPGYGDAAASPRRRIGGGRDRHHRRSAWFWPAIGLAVVGAVVVVVALVQGGSKTGTGAV